MERGIVLVSGGMDSLVVAAIAVQECTPAFLHVSYGQRTQQRELECFHKIADYYEVHQRLVVRAEALSKIGGSALTDNRIPVEDAVAVGERIPATYVPFRNTHLLATAVSWAEVRDATRIYIGAVEQDAPGYPDCRREYYQVFNELVDVGTRPETNIHVYTPLIGLSKSEIAQLGARMKVPFELTWSCYRATDRPCGTCHSCVLRAGAFREAGLPDPLLESPER
jgi:7-cyano-7-deazaguanine synthase